MEQKNENQTSLFPYQIPICYNLVSVYLVVPLHRNDTWLRSFSQQSRYFITPVVCYLHILNTCQSFFFTKVLLRFTRRSVFGLMYMYNNIPNNLVILIPLLHLDLCAHTSTQMYKLTLLIKCYKIT